MGDAKHTPGPWRIIPDNGNHYNRRITSDNSPHIAKVYGWGDEAIHPNARLIAAAPEMLEALIAAYTFIGDEYADAQSQALDGEYVSREARHVWALICNALAKATDDGWRPRDEDRENFEATQG